jgi:uncharacterized membrane protein
MLGATNIDLYIFILGLFVFSQFRYTLIRITLQETGHVRIKATFRRVRVTIVAVKKQ